MPLSEIARNIPVNSYFAAMDDTQGYKHLSLTPESVLRVRVCWPLVLRYDSSIWLEVVGLCLHDSGRGPKQMVEVAGHLHGLVDR